MMTTYERIKEYLYSLNQHEAVFIHNQYCDAVNAMDHIIFCMDEFDELFRGVKPWEIARTCFYGDFNPAHDWFWFNGYGNAESDDFPTDDAIDLEEIAGYISNERDDLGVQELAELL